MLDYNIELELFFGTKEYTVGTAPIGLLLLENDGTIICKSEYRYTNDEFRCECIIINSGEYYCGGDDRKYISLQII